MNLELGHLKYFYFVAKSGGFAKASRASRIQQSSLSRYVRLIEHQLGVTLFHRDRSNVVLTEEGRRLYDSCMLIFDEFEKIDRLNVRSADCVEGNIRFGASSSIASYLVPLVFERLQESHPRVLPMSYSAPAEALLEQVSDSILEFSILLYGGRIPNDLEAITLAELNHSTVILAQKYNSAEVRRSFIGTREGDSLRAKDYPTLKRIQEIDPKTQVRMSSNDLSCHKEFVLRGLGIAVLPDFSVRNELKNGTIKRVYPKDAFKFPVQLVKRKRKVLSEVGQVFVQALQATLNNVATPT